MKYSITHCYTDHNKGDAAIIISTTQLLRKKDCSARIDMFSTFGPNDEQFQKEHEFVSQFADNMYPGMFYQPRPVIGKSDASRILHFFWILLKFMLLLITKNKLVQKLFFTKLEQQGIASFMSSDVVISKGGSYITSQNTSIRQSISLFSMLYPFFLAKRYNKSIYIFSQSLGPVAGRFNQWLTKKALSGIQKIFLREDVCLESYKEIQELQSVVNMDIIPDSAFYMSNDNEHSKHEIDLGQHGFKVGMTIVDHAFKYISSESEKQQKIENYKKALIENIQYLIEKKDASIHIFPQVISLNSHLGHSDVRISREIEEKCADLGFGDRVTYHYGDFNPMQLRELYKNMDIFIGTRLHSVIFSLSLNVPSINIAYHGTKSQGILKAISGFEENVILIDEITTDVLRSKIDSVCENLPNLVEILKLENQRIKKQLEEAIETVVKTSR
jgi:colanic acid/amylovoran biosynthesis protein